MTATTEDSARAWAERADRATELIRRADFGGAVKFLDEALAGQEPAREQRDALYALAVAHRYLNQPGAALDALDRLQELAPDYGRAWQERGHTLLAMDAPERARAAYERALALNPALPASWERLGRLHRRAGDIERGQAARQKYLELKALPAELVGVRSMINEKRYYRAEKLCRHYLREHPHHVEAMRLLAAIGNELGVLSDAEFLLDSCLEFEPGNVQARYDYANLLLKMQRFKKAHEQSRRLLEADPDNLAYLSLMANAEAGIGRHREAIDLYDRVLKASPRQVRLLVMRGHAQKTIGEVDAAVRSYQRAYQLKPDHGDAYWSLANTKTYRFTDDEIRQMRERESDPEISREDRIHLCFALGKALEDRQEWEASFACYRRGNALKHESVAHRPTHLNVRTSAQIEVCDSELFKQKTGVGHPARDPIFIVGMPRAGSTLLEQILASHSSVEGTYELPNIIALAHRLRGSYQLEEEPGAAPRYPRILRELDDDYFRRFGKQYIDDTRVYRSGAERFIDKNPNNFFHIGLIRLILPNAKVIDARRHPLSCCFSGFKQLFGQGQEFSYDLETIGNYYREYVELMDHWDRVLPGFVLRVRYEDVVADLDGQVRRLLDFCELPFEDACLHFHRTERSVRTPSSEQVRQPIFKSGLEYWRHFEPWLGPLKEALGPEVRQRYSID